MSRGPQPHKAQDESLPIAEKRGVVQRYQHRRGNICDFSIMSPGLVSFVCAMRLVRLSSTPEDILHDFSSVIGQLRFIASSPAISRELWLRSPRGAWRFFRIHDDGILELNMDGIPLVNVKGPVWDGLSPGTGMPAIMGSAPPNSKKTGQNGRTAAGKNAGLQNGPAGAHPSPAHKKLPAPCPAATNPEPEKDPDLVPNPTGPVPESAGGCGSDPAQLPVPETNSGLSEETRRLFTGINLELIRRFTRWRMERKKKGPGSG
jgi:hypothetical protein